LRRLPLSQASKCDQAGDGKADPGRLEFWAERNNQQYRQVRQYTYCLVQQLERAGIGPMSVFEQHDNRLPASSIRQPAEKRFEDPLLLALRVEIERRIAIVDRH
jgi:hypothetical protein